MNAIRYHCTPPFRLARTPHQTYTFPPFLFLRKVEFDSKELGSQWLPDTDVMAHETKDLGPSKNSSPRTPTRHLLPLSPLGNSLSLSLSVCLSLSLSHMLITQYIISAGLSGVQQIEVNQLYELIKLLKQKGDLIHRLRRMNEEAEKMVWPKFPPLSKLPTNQQQSGNGRLRVSFGVSKTLCPGHQEAGSGQ